MSEKMKAAPMLESGRCAVCGDCARDCSCHLCPDCESGIRGSEDECRRCGYTVDEF